MTLTFTQRLTIVLERVSSLKSQLEGVHSHNNRLRTEIKMLKEQLAAQQVQHAATTNALKVGIIGKTISTGNGQNALLDLYIKKIETCILSLEETDSK